MKKNLIFTLMVILLPLAAVTAQGTSFGILGGVNFQNLNGKNYDGDKLENDLITGFHAGINLQIPLVPEFYFQPGLMFSTKGAQHDGTIAHTTTNLSYVELPLNLVYKGSLGSGFVMLGFGPYVGYAVKGKVTTDIGSVSDESDITFQNTVEVGDPLTVPYYKAFDAGGNIFFGYETAGGLFALLNSQLGLIGINPEYKILNNDESVIKNTGFGFSLGYRF
ncbi:MAG: porin family protein [Bacteroidales bacterium]